VTIAALVMAGGKARRMQSRSEKPLILVDGKSMIQSVIHALRQSISVDRIIVAVTAETPETAKAASDLGVDIVQTPGEGYAPDMKSAIKTLGLNDVVVISADLPFVTAEMIDQAVREYLSRRKPSLMVANPVEFYKKLGLTPSYIFEVNGRRIVPIGLNVINGARIDEPKLDETILVTERECLAFNVNTPDELDIARRYLTKMKKRETGAVKATRTYRLARLSALSALSVIGSFIHLPAPIQTVAFDSAPGYFAALFYGPLDGAAVCGIGHLVTSVVNGFPLGILHLPIAVGLAFAGAATGFLNLRYGYAYGAAIGVAINTGLVVIAAPALGWAATLSLSPFLLIAAIANASLAVAAYASLRGRVRY
jgi:adenosylcobinamide-phosphate guanylyltransferase